MSEETQTENNGIGLSGIVGGGIGLAGGAVAGNHIVANHALKHVIQDSDKQHAKLTQATEELITNNPELGYSGEAIHNFNEVAAANVKGFHFRSDPEIKGSYNLHYNTHDMAEGVDVLNQKTTIFGLKNLPEGVEANQWIEDPSIIQKVFKGTEQGDKAAAAIIKKAESNIINDIRKVGGKGWAFKNMGVVGKGAVIGVALAGTAAGAMAANAIFGGKHTDQVAANNNREQEPTMGRSA